MVKNFARSGGNRNLAIIRLEQKFRQLRYTVLLLDEYM